MIYIYTYINTNRNIYMCVYIYTECCVGKNKKQNVEGDREVYKHNKKIIRLKIYTYTLKNIKHTHFLFIFVNPIFTFTAKNVKNEKSTKAKRVFKEI